MSATTFHLSQFRFFFSLKICVLFFCIVAFIAPSSIFASSYAFSVPQGKDIYMFMPRAEPLYGTDPGTFIPLGFGTAASRGSTLDLHVSIPSFLFPVDVYLAITCDAISKNEIYLFTSDNRVIPLSTAAEDIRFRAGTMGNSYDTVFENIPVSLLPPAEYLFYLFVTPEGSFASYVAWVTDLDLTYAASGGGGSGSAGTGGGTAGTVAGTILSGLGSVSSGNFSNAVNILISTIQEGSLDSVVSAIVAKHPEAASMISKTSDGYKVDFGSGYTFTNGTTVSGSMAVALTQHQTGQSTAVSTRQAVMGSFMVDMKKLKVNGVTVPDDKVIVNLQADVLGQGGIEGVLAVPAGYGTTTGGVVFDTRKCPNFPLAGYLKVGNDIVNVNPDCSGTYSAGGNDIPVLESITPSQITKTGDVFSTSLTLHGKNLWPPYIYDHEGGLDADYNYRCHLRIAGYDAISDTYIDKWTADSITFSFPRAEQAGIYEIYLECPWANVGKTYYDNANKVTLTVK